MCIRLSEIASEGLWGGASGGWGRNPQTPAAAYGGGGYVTG